MSKANQYVDIVFLISPHARVHAHSPNKRYVIFETISVGFCLYDCIDKARLSEVRLSFISSGSQHKSACRLKA